MTRLSEVLWGYEFLAVVLGDFGHCKAKYLWNVLGLCLGYYRQVPTETINVNSIPCINSKTLVSCNKPKQRNTF